MRLIRRQTRRRGATLVEIAVILPLMLLLMLAAIDTASGVYRYQQVATLAREGARYASVHAGMYSVEKSKPVATADETKTKAVVPRAANLDPAQIICTLTWVHGSSYPWSVSNDMGGRKTNSVRFTVTYPWKSLFLLGNTITLTSTSEMTISY
jgi:Flp pilus assembly protein TadG